MFSRPKNWISGGVWKPKNPHSLEHLKYLHSVLCKNQAVTEQNRALLVETLRSISEILIWGDQNDGTVFDFFLEKNMLSFFLRFMRQKYGRFICVQLLQTLNILFENIRNETSVYYLLSNNHVNCIIVHKFDFSDEEVMAYYISFLKTLSLRLNKHTIHFFYNEHTNDFPLYTEAIKFFNHSETMVRIAVRTITLNVYKVLDKSMLRYIRDKTAAPYFSNLVWFIGNNVLDLDLCVRHDTDHNSKDRLSDLVAEHLDHLHYLNDILCLNIDALNEVLTDHLLNNLLLPLYVYSLTKRNKYELRSSEKPHVNPVVSLFLLSQVFLIMRHKPLVRQLADIIFHGDLNIFNPEGQTPSPQLERRIRGFVKPSESLAKTLDKARGKGGKPIRRPNYRNTDEPETDSSHSAGNSTFYGSKTDTIDEGDYYNIEEIDDPERDDDYDSESASTEGAAFYDAISGDPPEPSSPGPPSLQSTPSKALDSAREQKHSEVSNTVEAHPSESSSEIKDSEGKHSEELAVYQNVTDDEKLMANIAVPGPSEDSPVLTNTDVTPAVIRGPVVTDHGNEEEFTLENRPYLQVVFGGLHSSESDYHTLFSLCLLYALGHNTGINQELLDTILMPTEQSHAKDHYNVMLVESLIHIISRSCQNNSKVRLATLELAIKLLKSLVFKDDQCFLQDGHLAAIEGAREEATLLLRNFYKVWEKSEEIFLDMFEDEFREMKTRPLNVEYLTMDASILLPPTGTPLTGIDFIKRLPCGEVEKARKAIRVFFYVRDLSLTLRREAETDLPLTKQEECVKLGDVLDLNTKMFVFRETNIPYLEYYRVKITKTSKDNSDLIACTVVSSKENKRERRFLVIDVLQLILVEPDSRKLGWGLVKFIGFLQDVEVTGDKEDSRSLHITIHKPSMNVHAKPLPLLSAKFMFDDHIRCMAAKQRLSKGRLKARQRKMQMIAKLLELPAHIVESMYQPPTGSISQSAVALRTSGPGGSSSAIPGRSHQVKIRTKSEVVKKSVFANVDQSSAFASAQDQQSKQSQKDHLPSRSSSGAKSRSSRSSGGQPGVVKRVPGGRSQKKSEQPSPQQMCRGSPDIEQAEEAHPSPEMAASRSDKSSSSGRTIVENVTPAKEVPFEDISKRASKLLSGTRELFQGSLSQLQNESSPKRQRSVSSSEVASGSSTPSSDRSRASSRGSVKGRDRAGSCPSPEPHDQNKSLGDGLQHISSHHQNKNSNNGEEYDSSESPPRVRRSSSKDSTGPCPKTLTPAQAPALSLVKSCDVSMSENMNIPVGDSPMLLPPADPERFCGLREASQSSSSSASVGTSVFSETNLAQSLSEKLEFEDSIRSGDDDSKEISNNSDKEDNFESEGTDEAKSGSKEHHSSSTIAIPKTKLSAFSPNILSKTPPTLEETSTTADLSKIERVTESSESATSQLTKLAQIVSEHYSSFEDDKDSIEMTQNTNVEEKSDRVSEGTVHTHTDSSQENSPVAESRDQ